MHIWRNTPALDLITQGFKCIRSSHWPAGIYPWHSIWYLSGSAMRVEGVCQSSLRIPMHSCSKIVQRQSNSLRRASKPLPYCLLNRCYWLAGPRLVSLWNLEFQADQESVNIRKKIDPKAFRFQVPLRLTQTVSVYLLHEAAAVPPFSAWLYAIRVSTPCHTHFVANAASHEVLVKSQHETTKNGATWSNKPSKNNSSQYYTAPTSSETVLDHQLFTLKSLKIGSSWSSEFWFHWAGQFSIFHGCDMVQFYVLVIIIVQKNDEFVIFCSDLIVMLGWCCSVIVWQFFQTFWCCPHVAQLFSLFITF